MSFDAAIERICKPLPPVDYQPALDRQRAMLMAERDRHLREVNRLENILWGVDRAIELLGVPDDGQKT